ncbi:PDZ domain (Also known as DHR or GLGF) domain-containing protein [Phthorimaea operculella]|nr:PDZ domain (Also known as DHR or GLGF) domain-containing protein [Phthorimaea operculella]
MAKPLQQDVVERLIHTDRVTKIQRYWKPNTTQYITIVPTYPIMYVGPLRPRTKHDTQVAPAVRTTMSANGTTPTTPRLCRIKKVPDFDGYGFNLHAEKGKPGHYIGKVDVGSPAETAGLRTGDRLLEVNGHSIGDETHKQVVARIKERPNDAELLVVAPAPGESLPDLEVTPERINSKQPNIPSPPTPNTPTPKLNLQMTAAEMRARLADKKKFDPKKIPMDLKSKYDIVKKL